MIKGGGTINNQISEAYSGPGGPGAGKMGGNNIKNGSFYQSKYMSGANGGGGNGSNANQSPSPSQTFFKENPPMMMMDPKSGKAQNSLNQQL